MGLGRIGRSIARAVVGHVGKRAARAIAQSAPFIVTPVAIGAGLSAGALALFFNIADDVREVDGVWRFDHDGLKLALSLRNPRRTALMKCASALARPDVMSGLGLAGVILLWRRPEHRAKGVLLGVILTGGGIIIGGIKHRYERARPTIIEALAQEGTFSFPSGHSFISLCFYGLLTYFWVRSRPDLWRRVIVGAASGGAVTLIGASRVYLGVHYPSDVLAGYAAAVPWLTACLTAYHNYEKRVPRLLRAQAADAAAAAARQ
ncbi:MAG TPA: phosphatase PAP2 family protein [Armatimonadaceae bacterium]|nr:phosphatase PAP2 family protein [Armatimonadaceae bacterium]